MRPVTRGDRPLNPRGTPKTYATYDAARGDLIERMGQYCSYCNQKLPASLAVEHVQPKALIPALTLEWDNFLLGCTNCNSTKGDTPVDLDDFIWPDKHNTHKAFVYLPNGTVEVNTNLDTTLQEKAQKLLRLVGLQKYPDNPTASDRRWLNRRETYQKALVVLDLYTQVVNTEHKTEFEQLIGILVAENGFFSIWMQVFDQYTDVKHKIIQALPGTASEAFDANANPLNRIPNEL